MAQNNDLLLQVLQGVAGQNADLSGLIRNINGSNNMNNYSSSYSSSVSQNLLRQNKASQQEQLAQLLTRGLKPQDVLALGSAAQNQQQVTSGNPLEQLLRKQKSYSQSSTSPYHSNANRAEGSQLRELQALLLQSQSGNQQNALEQLLQRQRSGPSSATQAAASAPPPESAHTFAVIDSLEQITLSFQQSWPIIFTVNKERGLDLLSLVGKKYTVEVRSDKNITVSVTLSVSGTQHNTITLSDGWSSFVEKNGWSKGDELQIGVDAATLTLTIIRWLPADRAMASRERAGQPGREAEAQAEAFIKQLGIDLGSNTEGYLPLLQMYVKQQQQRIKQQNEEAAASNLEKLLQMNSTSSKLQDIFSNAGYLQNGLQSSLHTQYSVQGLQNKPSFGNSNQSNTSTQGGVDASAILKALQKSGGRDQADVSPGTQSSSHGCGNSTGSSSRSAFDPPKKSKSKKRSLSGKRNHSQADGPSASDLAAKKRRQISSKDIHIVMESPDQMNFLSLPQQFRECLPASMGPEEKGASATVIDERGAKYPIVVEPLSAKRWVVVYGWKAVVQANGIQLGDSILLSPSQKAGDKHGLLKLAVHRSSKKMQSNADFWGHQSSVRAATEEGDRLQLLALVAEGVEEGHMAI